jgi:hypothetical protein
MHKPDFFDGFYRCTFTGKGGNGSPLYLLETSGIIIPGTDAVLRPLKFYDAQRGVWIRPASILKDFDYGSVPSLFQSVVSPIISSRAFAMHDSSYVNHGWWECNAPDGKYVFYQKTRHECDHMLIRQMIVDDSSVREAELAFEGVYLFGGEYWENHKGMFPVGTCEQEITQNVRSSGCHTIIA